MSEFKTVFLKLFRGTIGLDKLPDLAKEFENAVKHLITVQSGEFAKKLVDEMQKRGMVVKAQEPAPEVEAPKAAEEAASSPDATEVTPKVEQ